MRSCWNPHKLFLVCAVKLLVRCLKALQEVFVYFRLEYVLGLLDRVREKHTVCWALEPPITDTPGKIRLLGRSFDPQIDLGAFLISLGGITKVQVKLIICPSSWVFKLLESLHFHLRLRFILLKRFEEFFMGLCASYGFLLMNGALYRFFVFHQFFVQNKRLERVSVYFIIKTWNDRSFVPCAHFWGLLYVFAIWLDLSIFRYLNFSESWML